MEKVLTVRQPWASTIVEGIKDIENRTWRTNFRGRILIHASMKQDIVLDIDLANECSKCNTANIVGEIIGSVEIVDCVVNHPSKWAEKTPDYVVGLNPNIHEDITGKKVIYNWILANPILFDKSKRIKVKGKLGLWNL